MSAGQLERVVRGAADRSSHTCARESGLPSQFGVSERPRAVEAPHQAVPLAADFGSSVEGHVEALNERRQRLAAVRSCFCSISWGAHSPAPLSPPAAGPAEPPGLPVPAVLDVPCCCGAARCSAARSRNPAATLAPLGLPASTKSANSSQLTGTVGRPRAAGSTPRPVVALTRRRSTVVVSSDRPRRKPIVPSLSAQSPRSDALAKKSGPGS